MASKVFVTSKARLGPLSLTTYKVLSNPDIILAEIQNQLFKIGDNTEVIDNEIVFTIETEHLGKCAIIDSLIQVLGFWKEVMFYRVFKRQPFDSVIIKIIRDDFPHQSSNRRVKK